MQAKADPKRERERGIRGREVERGRKEEGKEKEKKVSQGRKEAPDLTRITIGGEEKKRRKEEKSERGRKEKGRAQGRERTVTVQYRYGTVRYCMVKVL